MLASTDPVQRNSSKQPQITFKFQKRVNGGAWSDVTFNDPSTATEMIDGFQGSPSAYFVFAVPQDGIDTPADFNVSASGYLRSIWNGKSAGAGKGTISAKDANGFYTVTLTGITVPDNAVMLTGGLGYTYNNTATPPLVQTDLAAFPTTTVNLTAGSYIGTACTTAAPCVAKTGGLIVAPPNVKAVAKGYTGRRAVVDNDKCKACHAQLGAEPSFHAGQRNDGESCAFCHRPNQTSSGWSANAKDFIHGIHGAAKRTNPFTWHAVSATEERLATFSKTVQSSVAWTCGYSAKTSRSAPSAADRWRLTSVKWPSVPTICVGPVRSHCTPMMTFFSCAAAGPSAAETNRSASRTRSRNSSMVRQFSIRIAAISAPGPRRSVNSRTARRLASSSVIGFTLSSRSSIAALATSGSGSDARPATVGTSSGALPREACASPPSSSWLTIASISPGRTSMASSSTVRLPSIMISTRRAVIDSCALRAATSAAPFGVFA